MKKTSPSHDILHVEKPGNQAKQQELVEDTRSLFSNEGIYKSETISRPLSTNPKTHAELLLKIRMDFVRQFAFQASVLDVCCANGQHLIGFADIMKQGVGIDFSELYIKKANENKHASILKNADFLCGDAKRLPFHDNYFDVAYSFSSLYIIPDVGQVISEIGRTLKPGGKCILDLGNYYSLNEVVCRSYPELARTCNISVPSMKRMIQASGLKILKHRAFQLLPLWADRPKWLGPLLSPKWTHLFGKEVKGKMLDEWISNFPVLKAFAFRHIFVCEKR